MDTEGTIKTEQDAETEKQQALEFRKIEAALNDIGLSTSTLSHADTGNLVRQLLEQGVSKMSARILEEVATLHSSLVTEKVVFEATSQVLLNGMRAEAEEATRLRSEAGNASGAGEWLVRELSQQSWSWLGSSNNLIQNFKQGSFLPYHMQSFVRFVAIAAKALERDERWFV